MSARDPVDGASAPAPVLTPQVCFEPPSAGDVGEPIANDRFQRHAWDGPGGITFCLDRFPDQPGAACCFLRRSQEFSGPLRIAIEGSLQFKVCASGGWLLMPRDGVGHSYWIPRAPLLRRIDQQGHVLAERAAPLMGLDMRPDGLALSFETSAGWHLDWVVWQFAASARAMAQALDRPVALERQPLFFWGSKTVVRSPADAYLHLIHGAVYANDFVFPRHWKFYSEHDAQALYLGLDGLELATGKPLYGLLKRQVLYSVIARQQPDGRWQDGEWTDLMESHYRSHNGAMLMLATAYEEHPAEAVRSALSKAVDYSVSRADKTEFGPWFLHDSLEESAAAMNEMLRQTGTRWVPSRALGKSPCNKFILNTHLDAVVAIDRYREVSGDGQHTPTVEAARRTTLAVLGLRPAKALYRVLYWAVGLTLLPTARAEQLPRPLRLVKRLTWMYLIPNLYRVRHRFPRMVMPGGLIERHLSSLHFGTHYHAVNLMDLVRHRRRFPGDDLGAVIDQALEAGRRLLDHWAESKNRRFALVVWADALFQLCTLDRSIEYRRLLADAMLRICNLGLGFPPSFLGAEAEAVRPAQRCPCPSPADPRLRIANLSRAGRQEFIVVNAGAEELPLAWDAVSATPTVDWHGGDEQGALDVRDGIRLAPRAWVLGASPAD